MLSGGGEGRGSEAGTQLTRLGVILYLASDAARDLRGTALLVYGRV